MYRHPLKEGLKLEKNGYAKQFVDNLKKKIKRIIFKMHIFF